MTSLCLVALCAVGADPQPYPYPSSAPLTPPYVAEKRYPFFLKPLEKRIRAKVAELALPGSGKPEPAGSFLWQPSYKEDKILRGPTRPYVPQPGDIVMSADGSVFWKLMHNLAGTSHPTHSMIVFAMPDGRMAILEGGPHDTMKCRISNDPMPMPALVLTLRTIFKHRTDTPFTSSQTVRLSRCVYGVAGSHPTAHAAC